MRTLLKNSGVILLAPESGNQNRCLQMNYSFSNITEENITGKPYQNFNDSYVGDINSYIAAIVSVFSNFILIYATSQVKSYEKSVRYSQYSISTLRLIFSASIFLTCPVTCCSFIENGRSSEHRIRP